MAKKKSKAKTKTTKKTTTSSRKLTNWVCVQYRAARFDNVYCVYYAYECPQTPCQYCSIDCTLDPPQAYCGTPQEPWCDTIPGFGHGKNGHVHKRLKRIGLNNNKYDPVNNPSLPNHTNIVSRWYVDIELNAGGTRKIRAKLFDLLANKSGFAAQHIYHGLETTKDTAQPQHGTIPFNKVSYDPQTKVCYADFTDGNTYIVIIS